jgi:hypothetical protein
MQQENCDADENTSDGLFVLLEEKGEVVSVGDEVSVQGEVVEWYGLTGVRTTMEGVNLLSSGSPLPPPVRFSPPIEDESSRAYFESHEGMRVQMDESLVVGPTNGEEETWVVEEKLGISRIHPEDEQGALVLVDGSGGYALTAKVGDRIAGATGVLDYSLGTYRLLLSEAPTLTEGTPPEGTTFDPAALTAATFNLENLFDTADDPATEDQVLSAAAYQRKLAKLALAIQAMGEPLLIAVQEAESGDTLQALVNRLETVYEFVWVDGPDRRGIDVALLYQAARVEVLSYEARQGCTTLLDGLGPDGNGDVEKPANALTCDVNGDGVLDGNRLFSRPPLVVQVHVCGTACAEPGERREWWLIVVHLKSKVEDTGSVAYTQPRRLEQSTFIAALAEEILNEDPAAELIVLGDFNDGLSSETLAKLEAAGLVNLMARVTRQEQYTYIYQGISQTLDHVLVGPRLVSPPTEGWFPQPMRLNADFPAVYENDDSTARRSSDHDPLVAALLSLSEQVFLPLAAK